jgi:hypothetical protein
MLRCIEWRRVTDVSEDHIAFTSKLKQPKIVTDIFQCCLNLKMEILRSLETAVNLYPKI